MLLDEIPELKRNFKRYENIIKQINENWIDDLLLISGLHKIYHIPGWVERDLAKYEHIIDDPNLEPVKEEMKLLKDTFPFIKKAAKHRCYRKMCWRL